MSFNFVINLLTFFKKKKLDQNNWTFSNEHFFSPLQKSWRLCYLFGILLASSYFPTSIRPPNKSEVLWFVARVFKANWDRSKPQNKNVGFWVLHFVTRILLFAFWSSNSNSLKRNGKYSRNKCTWEGKINWVGCSTDFQNPILEQVATFHPERVFLTLKAADAGSLI